MEIAAAPDEGASDEEELPEFLYQIKELDLATGLNYCGDGEEYLLALKTYLNSAEDKEKEIRQYWAAGDIKNVTIKVHALKSASHAIGAGKLGEFAARLEQAGNSGDTETLRKELEDLLLRYRQLAEKLEPLRDPEETQKEDAPEGA